MNTNDALFAFIRYGLQIEDTTLREKVNWKHLYNLASEQGVIAIVAEGISEAMKEGLSTEGLDTELRQLFAFDMIDVEQTYQALWQSSKHLAELYHKHGIRTWALKGFVTSSFYPKPQQRIFCDFDCYLSDFKRGNEIVKQKGIEVAGSYKHATFNFEDVHVENHQFCTHFRGRKKAYQFELLLQQIMHNGESDYLDDSYIEKPSPLFNALFLTHHARSHFFDERVSLRQVVDWAMLMNYYGKDGLDWEKFDAICQEYGLLAFAQTLSRVARHVCHVEIPFVCPTNDLLDQMLLNDIFSDVQVHVEYGTGMRARWQIFQNKYIGRWKYKYFSDQSFTSAMFQQLWGFISEHTPTRTQKKQMSQIIHDLLEKRTLNNNTDN